MGYQHRQGFSVCHDMPAITWQRNVHSHGNGAGLVLCCHDNFFTLVIIALVYLQGQPAVGGHTTFKGITPYWSSNGDYISRWAWRISILAWVFGQEIVFYHLIFHHEMTLASLLSSERQCLETTKEQAVTTLCLCPRLPCQSIVILLRFTSDL